jgi:cytochrome c peroxidase
MRAGKLIAVAGLIWTCVLGWAVLIPGLQTPSSVLHAAADDDDRRDGRSNDRSSRDADDGRSKGHSDDRSNGHSEGQLDADLKRVLKAAKFTGRIESTLEARLGRRINPQLADLGRLLWFDTLHSLGRDNTCAGCHSPTNGFGDTQSIAIGVQNNNKVGPHRTGPRNQRRSPFVVNTAFFPKLMWNGRFIAPSGDAFDNSEGFLFPPPESDVRFPADDPIVKHLLQAQAHIPPTELVEVAGFTGTCPSLGPDFCQFEDGRGQAVPPPDESGFRNEPIRQDALKLLNGNSKYRALFGEIFPKVKKGAPIDFTMFGLAIAEFEFTLTFADAPLDQFARGERKAMTAAEKRGAMLFFGEARCVTCHAVAGESNEMFSDFQNRAIGVPQIAPFFGAGFSNMIYDGPDKDEDFGLEQITGANSDRYKFRTAPLRNLRVSPAFFHNGSFTRLEDAIRHHLNVEQSARNYDPVAAGVDTDLTHRLGPIEPVLKRVDKLLRPVHLGPSEFRDLVAFVRDGLFDKRASSKNLCKLVPGTVPSGQPVLEFEACK